MQSRLAAVVVFILCPLLAEDELGPKGVNIRLARDQGLNGKGHPVVILEHKRGSSGLIGIKPEAPLGSRLISQQNFTKKVPRVMPGEFKDNSWTFQCPPRPETIPPAKLFSGPEPCSPNFEPLGMNSDHATDVATIIAGDGDGIVPEAYVFGTHFSAGDVEDNARGNGVEIGALNEVRAAIDWLTRNYADSNVDGCIDRQDIVPGSPKLWNFSWGYPNDGKTDNQLTQFLDWFTWKFNGETMFVVAAGNEGEQRGIIREPGDLRNGITVGATDETLTRRAKLSNYRLPNDIRTGANRTGKPEILAPGKHGTSFAAPRVTGAALALKDNGFPGCCQFVYAWKAILLNSARKRGITGENRANAQSFDHHGTGAEESDRDYVPPPAAKKETTASWTPSEWTYDNQGVFRTNSPLDDEQGTGLLDVSRAILQMGGKGITGRVEPGLTITFPGGQQQTIPPPLVEDRGWSQQSFGKHFDESDATKITFGDTRTYRFKSAITKGTYITLTLTWAAPVEEMNTRPPVLDTDPRDCRSSAQAKNLIDQSDTYRYLPLPNLSLELWKGTDLVAISESPNENLQHLHFPAPSDGAPGEYSIVVRLRPHSWLGLSSDEVPALILSDPDGKLSLFKFGVGSLANPTSYGLAWWVQHPNAVQ